MSDDFVSLDEASEPSVNQSKQTRSFGKSLPAMFRKALLWIHQLRYGNSFQRIYRFLRRPLKRGVRAKAKKVLRRLFSLTLSEFLYRISFYFLAVIFVGLIVCTLVDMIPQSMSSGQFWNTIIIILTITIIFFLALILYIVRVIDTKRAIRRIPRAYLIHELGIPKRSLKVIGDERERCTRIFRNQVSTNLIHHPGLSNPKTDGASNGPFAEVVESIPLFIEWKVQSVDPRFVRPVGCDLRTYLERAVAHHIIDQENTGLVENFIELFERARFSGQLLSEEKFKELMLAMCTIIVAVSRNSQKFGLHTTEVSTFDHWDEQRASQSFANLDTFSDVGSVLVHHRDEGSA